jgi:hypothetical protein
MPSSSALVATITQSRPVSKAARRRDARGRQRPVRDEGRDVLVAELLAQLLGLPRRVDEDQALLARVQLELYGRAAFSTTGHVVERRARAVARARPGSTTRPAASTSCPTHRRISSGFPTVAESPIRCTSRPSEAGQSLEHRREVRPPVVRGEGVDLVDDDGAEAAKSSRVRAHAGSSTSPRATRAWSAGCPRAPRRNSLRAPGPTSPCHLNARRPTSDA